MGRFAGWSSLLITLGCLPGCDAAFHQGSLEPPAIDGGAAGDAPAPDAVPDAPPDAYYCEPVSAMPPSGHHNDGMSCIAAGCHLAGQTGTNAPPYAYAGTLYTTPAATTPMAGATVFIQLNGVEKKVITATNGNFFMSPGVAGLDSPTNATTGTTRVSACPNAIAMGGMLLQGGGNCNNCHRIGGTTNPIHLP